MYYEDMTGIEVLHLIKAERTEKAERLKKSKERFYEAVAEIKEKSPGWEYDANFYRLFRDALADKARHETYWTGYRLDSKSLFKAAAELRESLGLSVYPGHPDYRTPHANNDSYTCCGLDDYYGELRDEAIWCMRHIYKAARAMAKIEREK